MAKTTESRFFICLKYHFVGCCIGVKKNPFLYISPSLFIDKKIFLRTPFHPHTFLLPIWSMRAYNDEVSHVLLLPPFPTFLRRQHTCRHSHTRYSPIGATHGGSLLSGFQVDGCLAVQVEHEEESSGSSEVRDGGELESGEVEERGGARIRVGHSIKLPASSFPPFPFRHDGKREERRLPASRVARREDGEPRLFVEINQTFINLGLTN